MYSFWGGLHGLPGHHTKLCALMPECHKISRVYAAMPVFWTKKARHIQVLYEAIILGPESNFAAPGLLVFWMPMLVALGLLLASAPLGTQTLKRLASTSNMSIHKGCG